MQREAPVLTSVGSFTTTGPQRQGRKQTIGLARITEMVSPEMRRKSSPIGIHRAVINLIQLSGRQMGTSRGDKSHGLDKRCAPAVLTQIRAYEVVGRM